MGTIADGEVRRAYAAEFRDRLEALFGRPGRRGQGRERPAARPRAQRPPASRRRLARELVALSRELELRLLARLVAEPQLLAAHEEELGQLELDDPECERLRQELLHWYAAAGGDLDPLRLRDHLTRSGFGRLLESMQHATSPLPDAAAGEDRHGEWRELLQRLGRRAARRRDLLHMAELLREGVPGAPRGVLPSDERDGS